MTTLSRFGTHNQVLPAKGPKAYPFTLDFRTAVSQSLDFDVEITGGFIDYISGIFVDNTKNANPLTIKTASIGQVISIPAGKQAYMPLLISDAAQLEITTVQANNLLVPFFVVNFPVTPCVW